MNKKILIPIVLVLLGGGYMGYSKATAKPAPKLKISGTVYLLQKGFTLNMAGGQYATLTVGLLLPPTQSEGVADPANPPPTGFGTLPDEAPIRAIITNVITGQSASALIDAGKRAAIEKTILHDIKTQTDTLVDAIYFTDLAVQ